MQSFSWIVEAAVVYATVPRKSRIEPQIIAFSRSRGQYVWTADFLSFPQNLAEVEQIRQEFLELDIEEYYLIGTAWMYEGRSRDAMLAAAALGIENHPDSIEVFTVMGVDALEMVCAEFRVIRNEAQEIIELVPIIQTSPIVSTRGLCFELLPEVTREANFTH